MANKGAPKKLGELLVEAKVITPEQLENCLATQSVGGQRLGALLVEKAFAKDIDIAHTLANKLCLPYVDLDTVKVDAGALASTTEKLARKHQICPFGFHGKYLRVAMADPLDLQAIEDVCFHSGYEVAPAVALPSSVDRAIARHYQQIESLHNLLDETPETIAVELVPDAAPQADERKLRRMSESLPVVRVVNQIFGEAIRLRASDVHIEPGPDQVLVRIRTDGILRGRLLLPKWIQLAVVSRIKIMSQLDIATKRLPQDGRLRLRLDKTDVDLRVSTLPAQHGETVVIRVLQRQKPPSLDELGMSPESLDFVRKLVNQPQGAVLVTGPTGSGKTTSLYACLGAMKLDALKVVTLEDPIEYEMDKVNQVQINDKAGLTFGTGLRSILRQDPDVILVGEMRDEETASIALKASSTGHLVLSTLHTNSAYAAVTRLLDMNIPSYLVGSALTAVVSQRLVRVICENCKVPYVPNEGELAGLDVAIARARTSSPRTVISQKKPDSKHMTSWIQHLLNGNGHKPSNKLFKGAGCGSCAGTGYSGRMAIFEVLKVIPSIRELIYRNASEDKIRKAAEHAGMQTLLHQACTKLIRGETTVEEVIRVVAVERLRGVPCERCGASLETDFSACPYCGLSSVSSCSSCNRECDKEWKFCAYCQASLSPGPHNIKRVVSMGRA